MRRSARRSSRSRYDSRSAAALFVCLIDVRGSALARRRRGPSEHFAEFLEGGREPKILRSGVSCEFVVGWPRRTLRIARGLAVRDIYPKKGGCSVVVRASRDRGSVALVDRALRRRE